MKVNNPRFPHKCRIYRRSDDSFSDDFSEEVLYEGKCRKWSQNALRTFRQDYVLKGDYGLSIEGQIAGIKVGDLIDVVDLQGEFTECVVTDSYAGNLGTTVVFNVPMN